MDISSFQNLSRDEQLAEAGRIAGVEPSVFDGIHRTESGRGVNMVSPKGAEGHFGLMPSTRATWESRLGTSIDPYDFGQSLYAAAHTMKENMARFGNVPDALRAYNGGWDPRKWKNPETAAYAAKVLGTDDEPATDVPDSTAPTDEAALSRLAPNSAHDLWDTPFQRAQRPGKAPAKDKLAGAQAVADMAPTPQNDPTFKISNAMAQDNMDQREADIKLREDTTFLDAARAASNGEVLHQLGRVLFRDEEPIDPNFQPPEDALKGKTADQQRQLRAAGSQKELDRILFEQQDAAEQQEITFRRGTVFGMGATMLAELPSTVLLGGATTLGLGKIGLGAFDAARAGYKAKAIALAAVDAGVGNVAGTAALDMLGQHQTVHDYAVAAAGAILGPLTMGKALGRAADRALENQTALRIAAEATEKKVKLAAQAEKNLGPHFTPEELAAEIDRLDAEGVRAEVASHKAAVPESRRFNVGEEPALEEAGIAVHNTEAMPAVEPHNAGAAPYKNFAEAETQLGAAITDRVEYSSDTNALRREMLSDPTNPNHAKAMALWKEQTNGVPFEQVVRGKAVHYENIGLRQAMALDPELAKNVRAVQALAEEYMPNAKFVWSDGRTGNAAGASWWGVDRIHTISLNLDQREHAIAHLTHELGHAVFQQFAPKMSPRTKQMLQADWLDFVNRVKSGDSTAWDKRFSVSNQFSPRTTGAAWNPDAPYSLRTHEFMAEQFVTHIQNRIAKGDYGDLPKEAQSSLIGALRKVFKVFADLMSKGLLQSQGAEAFFSEVLRTSRMKTAKDAEKAAARAATAEAVPLETHANGAAPDVAALQADPISRKYGLDLLPMSTPAERATAKQIVAVYRRADAWAAANPIDEKRLSGLLAKFDSLSPTSNMMLRSDNPVVRMVASELLENGGGAAGRRSSAAVAKYMNERAIIGNVINELEDAFNLWHKGQPNANRMGEWLTGKKRVEFNRLVAEEIEQRRYNTSHTDLGDPVRQAADAVEASFERSRLMQIDAKTVGWASLPESSRGYMPHRMKPEAVRNLTLSQKRTLHSVLMDQFVGMSGFDMSFADNLASKYLDRVQRRALGGFDAPMGLHQVGAADVVREALEAMNLTRPELDAAMKRYAQGGAQHTKKRLNLDLRQTYTNDDGSTFRLLDLFDTDMLSLVRSQSQRVSGEVALARHGVMGKPGLTILREAMQHGGPGTLATREQLDAYDQVAAEFLGAPFGVQNKWVDRAMTANSVASLGGMGFNQLGELINVGTTLGVKSALSNVASFFRLRSEVLAAAKGKVVDNPIIGSLEKFGGAEFGTDAYKMVFPMDLPDAPIHTMGADGLHIADRLLRGAGHLQSKASLWRAISSVQQRGVAEQIVHSAARILKGADNSINMRDMGISDELVARLREDLPQIAQFNGDRLVKFDITKATDLDAAMQFTQAVHRGTNQIIQGTFIGETGKYVHNSYLKLLTQFRGFNITAVDKQWNRQAGNHGIAKALGITVGAMSVAAPIYIARTYLASIGRSDQHEFLDRMLTPGAIARATTNYIATSGFAGDFLDAFTAVTGTGEVTGGRSGTNQQMVGNLVAPVLGKVDKVWGAVQNTRDGTDVHGLLKELPLSRLPWFIPAINALGK